MCFCRRGTAVALLLLTVLVGVAWQSEWSDQSLPDLVPRTDLLAPTPAPTPASTPVSTPAPTSSAPQTKVHGLSLFCFAWTPRRKFDEELLSEVRIQFAKCDGHVFYTDTDSPKGVDDSDFVRVKLPAQKVSRDKGGWLYHRNMVGLMPALKHLLSSPFIEQYDWFINTELDHFLSPARARKNIESYEQIGRVDQRPAMLMWGNAFVFNRNLLKEMRNNWDRLGITATDNGTKDEAIAVGCPLFMKGKAEWPSSCSQDIIYPALAWDILPKISKQKILTLGDPGCGHPAKFQNQDLPLGCWEMQQNPLGGESLQGELRAIRVLADMGQKGQKADVCESHGLAEIPCKKFKDGRQVAVIHHVNNLAVHRLARQLLDEGLEHASLLASGGLPNTSAPVTVVPIVPPATAAPLPDAGNLTLFCFAWSPRRKNDEGVLNEVRKQYQKCDGHLFFTDTESPNKTDEEDFVRVVVPQQRLPRTHGQWLYHRNMVGLMPSWEYLLKSGVADQYDWLLNSELDHFLSPSRAKENIVGYLKRMEEGNKEDKGSVGGPIMLMWGNAFVFNRKLVQIRPPLCLPFASKALKMNWPLVGQVASMDNETSKDGRAVGCPLFMKGRSEWPDSCSQDIIYPALVMNILPPLQVKVAFPGASGCGQPSKNRKNREYPLGCWEMQQNPIRGESEAGELAAIKELAQMGKFQGKEEAKAYCASHELEAVQKNCMKFWDGRKVPLIHHLHTVSEHVLARSLLDP